MTDPQMDKNSPADSRPVANTRRTGVGLVERCNAYLRTHAQTLVASLGRIRKIPISSGMTILVIAVALSLPAGFYLLLDNLQQLSGQVAFSNQLSLFLKTDVSDADGETFARRFRDDHRFVSVNFISKTEGMAEFREHSGFGNIIDSFGFNPLPGVVQLQPMPNLAPLEVEGLVKELGALEQVDFAQMDMQWLKRLNSIMQIADRSISILSVLLAAAVLFVIGNTIRLELYNRREEIVITKLLGATDSFIRRPFVYSGLWYGLLGGIIAWLIVTIMVLFLRSPVTELSSLYEHTFTVNFLGFGDTLLLWWVSSVLGIVASWLTVSFHLNHLNPE